VISRHELPKLSANRVLQVGGKELAERKIDLESEAAGNRELKAPCIPRTPAKAPDARVAWSDTCHADDPPTAWFRIMQRLGQSGFAYLIE